MFTLSSDLFPESKVATIVGFASAASATGGIFIAQFTGFVLQTTKSYFAVFMIAGSAYLVALLLIQLLTPHLKPVDANRSPA